MIPSEDKDEQRRRTYHDDDFQYRHYRLSRVLLFHPVSSRQFYMEISSNILHKKRGPFIRLLSHEPPKVCHDSLL